MTNRERGRAWVEGLAEGLGGQKRILRGLLGFCEAEDAVRWLVIGCSLARGAGDGLSDLDLGMGVRDEDFGTAVVAVREGMGRLGDLVDSFHHTLPGVGTEHERIFAQYADRCQADLVVFPASRPIGSPRLVVLYDPDGLVTASAAPPPRPVTAEQVREWAFLGWCALADLGKYLCRGSVWEALERLHEARGRLWQLWAVAYDVPDPQYGLTSLLDFHPGPLPAGMDTTVAGLPPDRLLSAARALAGLLGSIGNHLRPEHAAALPAAMAAYITADLASIPAPGSSSLPTGGTTGR